MNTNKPSAAKLSFQEPELTVSDLSKALYETNRKLDQTIRERDEIFSNISHDLRAPITAIHNAIEYLESLDHISEEDIHDTLPIISERTQILEQMINEIFLLTKLDSQTSLLHPEKLCIGAFLEDFFYNSCDADSRFQNRQLVLDVPEAFNYELMLDPFYMTRVLDNLFGNALKYTSAGDTISLSASLHTCTNNSGSDTAYIQLAVSDTGKGICKEDLPHIFERTYMAVSARTPSENSGAGLGLTICKRIIELMRGRIWCESQEGKGSHFYIELPLQV